MSADGTLALLGWGILVGVDLVSVPQAMIARPLVAGTVAGALAGDLHAGLVLGVIFELFQLDVLPVGAVRYPEYGPATVAAVAAAHAGVLAPAVGLATALAGGASLTALRRLNTRRVGRAAAALDAGDPRALVRVHAAALARDVARAGVVTALGLLLAWGARAAAPALPPRATRALLAAAVGAALAAGAAGSVRVVGRGANRRWLAAGLCAGAVVAWLV